MNGRGFEALADAALLFVILAIGIGAVLSMDRGTPAIDPGAATAHAEDLRLALLRATPEGLGYARGGEFVAFPDGTTVETYLRYQVHLRSRNGSLDFSAANARVADLASSLVRPGWSAAIRAEEVRGDVRIELLRPRPATFYESAWTYPPVPGEEWDVRLSVAVWLSPR